MLKSWPDLQLQISHLPAQAPPPPPSLTAQIPAWHQTALDRVKPQLSRSQRSKLEHPLLVVWNYRMRSCAGRAIAGTTIHLNYRLLIHNPEELQATYYHELAHIWAYCLYGSRGHDQQWQTLMAWLGESATRTHRMNVTHLAYRQKRYLYRCDCQPHYLSAHRHAKIQRGLVYRCRTCEAKLWPVIAGDANSG